jgi:membrane associated rhomboid family serine protease
MGGHPIYANTLIIIFHVAAFVVSAISISILGFLPVKQLLELSTPEVWQGQVWRIFSYIAFDPYFFSQRSLWILVSLLLLYFFGREVEQFIGRKTYLKL